MQPLKQNLDTSGMAEIGSVANLGAEVLAGDPQATAKFVVGGPESALAVGLFGSTEGIFRVNYPFSEHATLLSGSLTLKNETTGVEATFAPGDSWFIAKGEVIVFNVANAFVKHYLSVA
ncbi:cupin domain-containing protein [Parathalassolituus penaei]|uniref:Cupin domain-containing protein n=1 Tax=Parathalassolituus penaei TaxID=2997323 RepID=A0A9X3EEX4_9GAMM|nr:cupin domain-containing protein [Parathalassolituus penaei]MCY0966317.1 cupin domain-containing protein [Parathalassolituus penaei]